MAETSREQLRARDDIDDADIDDIIGLAADLQEAARREREGPTAADVAAVAEELDIEAAYVDEAISRYKVARREAEAAAIKADLQRKERVVIVRRLGIAGVLAVACWAFADVYVASGYHQRAVNEALNVENAAGFVDLVLERQANLVPQLLTLGGGDASEIQAMAKRLRSAPTLAARLEASADLSDALTAALASLPQVADDTEAVQRLGLNHELTGVQNRMDVERRRLKETCAAFREQATALEGYRVGRMLGGLTVPPLPDGCAS